MGRPYLVNSREDPVVAKNRCPVRNHPFKDQKTPEPGQNLESGYSSHSVPVPSASRLLRCLAVCLAVLIGERERGSQDSSKIVDYWMVVLLCLSG